jgi:signal transduction histidine kinase
MQAPSPPHDDHADHADLLAHLPDGVLTLDAAGTIRYANPAAERIFGADAGGLHGRAGAALLGLDAGGLAQAADGGVRDIAGCLIDGAGLPLEVRISPMPGPQPDQPRFAAVVRDATHRRELDQRNQATDERRRKHFTTATHELRTPMASILGFSELLLKREFDPSTSRELVEIIHRQASRLVELINQLLDLARIEAGGVQGLQIQPVKVAELVEQTLAGLNGLGQNHRLRVALEDGLPPLAADAHKIQQALTNILSNGIKYSSEGSLIDIGACALQREGRPTVAIRIADRGIGMTAEQQARIFDAFYRAGQAPNVLGSGLGMTIFKEIVELHGGHAEIASQPGAGTTVTVWLPAEPGHG